MGIVNNYNRDLLSLLMYVNFFVKWMAPCFYYLLMLYCYYFWLSIEILKEILTS